VAQHPLDALIIGSGPNGLTAAITLAEQGRSVLLLEAAPRLGGAVATEELTLPGFLHDTFSSVYPAAAASPAFARMPLAQHGLRWIHPPVALAHVLAEGRAAALYYDRDAEQTAASLDCLAPGDGQRWRAFVVPYLKHFDALRGTLFGGFPPLSGGTRLLAQLGIERTLDTARLLLLSAEALTAELFHSPEAAAWLYGSALHSDVALRSAGSAIAGVYLQVLGHAVGWPSPQGGAGRLAAALTSYLHACGGQTRTAAPVERIVVERGRVVGVALAGGELVRARLVIGDLTPRGLLQLASSALPESYRARLQNYRYGDPTIKIDWALDGPIPWQAPEARQAGTVHVGGSADELQHALAAQYAGQIPARPFMLVGQQSLADPRRAPAGQHTAWGYTHTPHGLAWPEARDEYIDRMEEHIEHYAPGFRQRILARHVLTPPEMEQRNANLVGGDVGAGSNALDQLLFRPLPSLSPYRTPVRGLYLGSAATFPGPAVHGMGGYAAAQAALLDTRLPRLW
jgi:phytoene dehydrogenase-like protein